MAFLPGFLQVASMLMIESINYLVITVSDTVLDIAKDFTALMVISAFDDIFGALEGGNEIAKDVINDSEYEKIFMIETTTSKDAKEH